LDAASDPRLIAYEPHSYLLDIIDLLRLACGRIKAMLVIQQRKPASTTV